MKDVDTPEARGGSMERREFIRTGLRTAAVAALGGIGVTAARRGGGDDLVWQIDPHACVQCGNCATHCVLNPSAVACVHAFTVCGYCELCFGYFQPGSSKLNEGAENQLCPTGAITRSFVEEPYYEYTIDESLCIGCGKCVKGCNTFGNGSLFLQVRHDRCENCNECAIARACPADAFRRLPTSRAYLLKGDRPA
jgi:electron transport complex protein RnfB